MFTRLMVLSVLTVFLFPGCSSLLVKSTPAPVHYQLDYKPVTVDCPKSFKKGVRIWELGASSPYGQPEMVVVRQGQKVSFSSSFQWVSSPGVLVADSLLRDLSAGKLFPEVIGSNSPRTLPLELTGHIFAFSWEETGGGYRARLHLEISLSGTGAAHKVIMRGNYRLLSKPYQDNSSDNFARAMSSTVAEFSKRLQEDLCKAL